MEMKQEPLETYENTFVIKQESESTFQTPFTHVETEMVDVLGNPILHPLLPLKIKEEPRTLPIKAFFLNSKHVSNTQNSDICGNLNDLDFPKVKSFDGFVSNNDWNLIKEEITDIKYIIHKHEILSDNCDLPTLKSDVDYFEEPCSSKQNQASMKHPKYKTLKKKVKNYSCPICKKKCSSPFKRLKHLNGHFGKYWLACELCGHFFYEKSEYFVHYFTHFVKINTNTIIRPKLLLKKHKYSYTQSKSSKCNINHPKDHIKCADKKSFKCEICLKEFKIKRSLKEHLKTHTGEKPFGCEICLKRFIRKQNLNRHLKMHTGEKPFKCEICLRQFTYKSHLNEHLFVHTGEKPFRCEVCLRQFTRKRRLTHHLKIHTGESLFKCKICFKEFFYKHSLQVHLKNHTGEKSFKCKICPKQFQFKKSLVVHIKMHTGEYSFICEICSQPFKRKWGLNDHLKIHSGEKPFQCEICFKQFTRKSNLNRHLSLNCPGK